MLRPGAPAPPSPRSCTLSHATVTISPSCNMHLWGAYLSPLPAHGLGFPVFSKHPDLSASLFPLPECQRVLLWDRGPEDQCHPPGRACLLLVQTRPGQRTLAGPLLFQGWVWASCCGLGLQSQGVADATRLSVKAAPPIPDLPLRSLWVLNTILNSLCHPFLF